MASSEACAGDRVSRWACSERGGRSSRLVDLTMGGVLFLLAALVGVGYVAAWGDYQDFYQIAFGPAVMVALGHGYQNPNPGDIPGLEDFLATKTEKLEAPDAGVPIQSWDLRALQVSMFYLCYTVGLLWRLLGISWHALLPLYGLLYAVSVVAAFGIFRLGMGRLVSFVCAFVVMLSPLHLYYLPDLRDYSKAPFILVAVFVLGYLVKHPVRTRTLLLLSAGLGAMLGLGYGFRADALICVPAALVVVALFLPGGPLRRIKAKAGACCLVLAGFSMLVYPMFHLRGSAGGNTFHVMILGLMKPFDIELGLEETPIEFGPLYLDYYAFAMVKSYHERTSDPSHTDEAICYAGQAYDEAGGSLYGEYMRTFPANWIARWQAAVIRILNDIPFTSTQTNERLLKIEFLARLFNTRWHLLHWLCGLGSCAALVAIFVLSARSVRCSLALLLCLLYFLGNTSLQFQPRHYFHCEVAFWWVFGFLAYHTLSGLWRLGRAIHAHGAKQGVWAPVRQHGRAVLGRIAVVGVVATLILLAPIEIARACQTANVKALVEQVKAQPLVSLPLVPERDERGTLFKVDAAKPRALPTEASASGPSAEVVTDILDLENAEWLLDIKTRYLVAEVECPGRTSFIVKYTALPEVQGDFTTSVTLASDSGSPVVYRYFFPVYEPALPGDIAADAGVRFAGLSFPRGEEQRLRGLYEIEDLSPFRLLLTMSLTDDQGNRPLYSRVAAESPSIYPRGLAASRHNLLDVGDFELWSEEGAPVGFEPPRQASTIEQECQTVWEGHSAVRQTWEGIDAGINIFHQFHLVLRGLQPDTCYELFTAARCYSGEEVCVSAWQFFNESKEPKDCKRLSGEVLAVTPNCRFNEYSGTFRTLPGESCDVVLTTFCRGSVFPATIVWDDWRLVPGKP